MGNLPGCGRTGGEDDELAKGDDRFARIFSWSYSGFGIDGLTRGYPDGAGKAV